MKLLAERGVEVFFTQVFRDSFFHADMHPGNIFVSFEHPRSALDRHRLRHRRHPQPEDKRYLAENFLAFFNRDYRRWPAARGVRLGTARYQGGRVRVRHPHRAGAIFEKPLSRSPSATCCSICSTPPVASTCRCSRSWCCCKDPALCGRAGSPALSQLDLWQTIKPYLENWMHEQVGPKGGVECHQEKAPFWAEKAAGAAGAGLRDPASGRHQQHHFDQMFADFRHSRRQGQARYLLGVGASLLLAGVFFADQKQHIEWGQISLAGAGLCWLLGWFANPFPLNNLPIGAYPRESHGWYHIWQLLIIAVIVVLLFGTKKLRGIGGDLGAAVKGVQEGALR